MRPMSKTTRDAVARLVARSFDAKLKNDGRPFMLAHWITNRCMCKCASCLWRHNDWEEVPYEEITRFYAEAKQEGFLATAFTGGEPFLRKDFGDIVRYVKQEAGMSILTFTTGFFLQKRMHEVLPHLDMLVVSLDSAIPERHDEIRGVTGLFEKAVQGAQEAKRAYPDLSIQFNTCVQKGIENEIDGLLELAKRVGIRISFDVITEFRHGEEENAAETDCGLGLPELQKVCADLIQRKAVGAPIVNSDRYFQYFVDGRPGYTCHHPKLLMGVDGRGNIEDCLNLDQPIANILDMALKDILELPRFKQLRSDAERCCTCSSPTMVDLSHLWENPAIAFTPGGIHVN